MLVLLVSCKKGEQKGDLLFETIAPSHSGIYFKNELTEDEGFNIIEYLYFYNGGGVSIGDINNDGLPDIYFSSNQGHNKLYLNKGNFEFEDITESAGVSSPGPWKTGITMADVNGDGFLDIYVCRVSGYKGLEGKNELYINNGDLTFTEMAADYGLDFRGFSTQAAFFDYDGDGDLDMYLLNHAVHTERSYGRASLRHMDHGEAGDRLYRNNLDKGETRFTAVTGEAGIYSSHIGYGLGVGIADLNNDGWPDIYVSNDFNENDYLYLNNKDGTFREVSESHLGHGSRFSMGNDLADFNNDGWVDILALDMHPEDEVILKKSAGEDAYEIYDLKLRFGYGRQVAQNTLQLNNGNGTFSEIAQLAGLHATDWSWSALFADFDLDGFKDIFISNGIKRRPNDMDYINFITDSEISGGLVQNPDMADLKLAEKMPPGEVHDFFFKNNGNLTFENTGKKWGIKHAGISNGTAYADLDNDGDLDLIVNHINQPASIYKNTLMEKSGENKPSYLKIKFKGVKNNHFGIGAKLYAYHNEKVILYENHTTRGFQSSIEPSLHMGLGNAQQVDSLLVVWPGGKQQLLKNVSVNQTITLSQADARESNHSPLRKENIPILLIPDSTSLDLAFEHWENEFNDFNQEYLLPHKISREGPKMALGHDPEGGMEYLFLGGAKDQSSEIHRFENGVFTKLDVPELTADSLYEDIHAVFFDSNQNGLQDLFVVSGGNEPGSDPNMGRLYLNKGNSHFVKSNSTLPELESHFSVVIAGDFDGDGRPDLFLGSRTVPGRYGERPKSYLLKNLGDGKFEDVTQASLPDGGHLGMVKDAAWVDLSQDGKMDLVILGEWMPITVLINDNGKFTNQTNEFGLGQTHGWWHSLEVADVNHDGFPDLIAGNQGLNHKLKPPLKLYVDDFDGNGKTDPVISYTIGDEEFPVAMRDELIRQIPSLKKEFGTHQKYAGTSLSKILDRKTLEKAETNEALEFRSMVFINESGKRLTGKPLPLEAQFSPVEAILVTDLDNDGLLDLVLGGNFHHAAPYYGPYDASQGWVLKGTEEGEFKAMNPKQSGLSIKGDIKDIKLVQDRGSRFLLFSRNDDRLVIYKLR
ncbi:VCBS repeat-containing protein [Negadavirga shengliensis]|uniref:VCBS repeat-containing protein n=1 Tax=Negadavirga shengliensis TaxID=1389218 RepID=A0ABV9SZ67_9BACT